MQEDALLALEDETAEQPSQETLIDYISGQQVRATPEEVDAVQVFARRLVEDYDYPKIHIQTRPQYRVRRSPSDEARSYQVDIALFKSDDRVENNLYLVVECKKKTRREGLAQLQIYMDMSSAELGVWFNGNEHIYLLKAYHPDGTRTYEEIPNIPRYMQRVQDVGLYTRNSLSKPSNLRAIFKDLRNHLAGMTTGITRDEALAQEIINILFCKILDEQDTAPGDIVTFRAGVGESSSDVAERIKGLFEKVKQASFEDVFGPEDKIKLDDDSLTYVVGELQNYAIMESDRDAIGDAFEVFIGPALRGAEGQFFTPRNVVKMMVEILDPKPGEIIIDPACGSGGFLIMALSHIWEKVQKEGEQRGWSESQILRRQIEVASNNIRGIDKDAFLAKVCKAYLALIGDGRGGIFCANTLAPMSDWQPLLQDRVRPGTFDLVLTNPPFGKNIVVRGSSTLSQYDLGFKWVRNAETGEMEKGPTLHEDQPPQILFIDRALQLLKPGGRLGIVVPEAVFGMPTYEYVVTYLRKKTKIRGIVSMPEALFKTSGKGGTHAKVVLLFAENTPPEPKDDFKIFMADAKWCGHDSRGNPTFRKNEKGQLELLDDVPIITERFKELVGSW